MKSNNLPLFQRIAETINASSQQVRVAVEMLDNGDTVPFISRYRKEATGGLTDTQLRYLEQRLSYLREFDARKESIISAIEEQGALTDALRSQIMQVDTKSALEDLYLPYKKKRRTKGQIAIEAGLEPLADLLWDSPEKHPGSEAAAFVKEDLGIVDEKTALDGARSILVERFAEEAVLIGRVRDLLQNQSYLCASVSAGKDTEGEKFRDYFDHQEHYSKVPGHRALAMFRGRKEGVLSLRLLLKEAEGYGDSGCIDSVARHLGFSNKQLPSDQWREQVVSWVWKIKLVSHLEIELFTALKIKADAEAISVFAANLQDLLLSAPAGARPTLGLDPGYRSGVKVTVIDANGKVVQHDTIYPHAPQKQWDRAVAILNALCKKHKVELIAVGNGTASRETEKLAEETIKTSGVAGITKVLVSEAGASVYSASKIAEDEFPDLDVTIRGAVSIARRLQDPLAELVKIDPKAIGVGQYQHDVSQTALARSLEATVEDCVNAVGVNLDTASAALLSRVAGLSTTLADNIVAYRDEHGTFDTRAQLKKVPRLGPKAFEQCAGFLRIPAGSNPLDASGVHPETYAVVKRIIKHAGRELSEVIGDTAYLASLNPHQFTDEQFGELTVKDILLELDKPGRDPRPEFKTVKFRDGVESINDLQTDQILEGQVTSVTAFGAFVDIGVHQDGLVHISALADTYIKDPRSVVKAGDIVKVKVTSVDVSRNRIALSMRLTDGADDSSSTRVAKPQRRETKRSERSKTGKPLKPQRQATQTDAPSALALSLKTAMDSKSKG
ncbi:MAG: Tex family protein [Granulosicoccaceae bacterium]